MIIQFLMLVECELDQEHGGGVKETVERAKIELHKSHLMLPPEAVSYYIDSVVELYGPPPEKRRSPQCTGCPKFPYKLCLVCAGFNKEWERGDNAT